MDLVSIQTELKTFAPAAANPASNNASLRGAAVPAPLLNDASLLE